MRLKCGAPLIRGGHRGGVDHQGTWRGLSGAVGAPIGRGESYPATPVGARKRELASARLGGNAADDVHVKRRISSKLRSRQLPGGLTIPKKASQHIYAADPVPLPSLTRRHDALRTHRRRQARACRRQHWSMGRCPSPPRAQRLPSPHASCRQAECKDLESSHSETPHRRLLCHY